MLVVEGLVLALGGALAGLTGLTGLARVRRLRRGGQAAWATIVPALRGEDEPERMSLQFALADGRVIERPGGQRPRRTLAPGQKVLVWYDPADPGDVVTYGREGRRTDLAFLAAGLVLIAVGLVLAGS
jgi:Protein of unknown function (DUF3592)